jgi:hypothetical protein
VCVCICVLAESACCCCHFLLCAGDIAAGSGRSTALSQIDRRERLLWRHMQVCWHARRRVSHSPGDIAHCLTTLISRTSPTRNLHTSSFFSMYYIHTLDKSWYSTGAFLYLFPARARERASAPADCLIFIYATAAADTNVHSPGLCVCVSCFILLNFSLHVQWQPFRPESLSAFIQLRCTLKGTLQPAWRVCYAGLPTRS